MDATTQYFCQSCKELHRFSETDGTVFKTGFVYVSEVKYPMGVCKEDIGAYRGTDKENADINEQGADDHHDGEVGKLGGGQGIDRLDGLELER